MGKGGDRQLGKGKVIGEEGVEKVPLCSLKRTRRGKHRVLIQLVLEELISLSPESAVNVSLGVYSAMELHPAVVRLFTADPNIQYLRREFAVYLQEPAGESKAAKRLDHL